MTNEECIEKFMGEYKHNLEESTLKIYYTALRDFLLYSQTSFQLVTSRDIRRWILELEEKHYNPNTINTKIIALKTFYRFCYEEEFITHNPMDAIKYQTVPLKPVYYLTQEQLNQLRHLVEDNREYRALIEILYSTGMRISEVVNIRKEDIDWSQRLIFVPKSKRKKERIVCFTTKCEQYLQAYLSTQTSPHSNIFRKGAKTYSYIRIVHYKFQEYAQTLGFRVKPHTLRHTFAAHLAKKGMPFNYIQVLLGHESPQQTLLYARLYEEARKDIYDQWM